MNKRTYVATYSGKKFYPFDPQVEDIDILDIASSLSKQCRYSGHTTKFYSVAEHSVLVSSQLDYDDILAKWGLLHDAGEAYITDVPKPIKSLFPRVQEAENKILQQVAVCFDLPWPIPKEVHRVDQRMIYDEAPALMKMSLKEMISFPGSDYELNKEQELLKLGVEIKGFEHNVVKSCFLNRYDELFYPLGV